MKKVVLLFAIALFSSYDAFAQEPFVFLPKDDAYPLKGDRKFMAVGQENEISFQSGNRVAAGSLLVYNGRIDSIQLNPDDPYSYYLTPDSAGLVTIQAKVFTTGQDDFKLETVSFEAVKMPIVNTKLLKDEYVSRKKISFGLIDKRTGKPLPKCYIVGHFFDVAVYDGKGNKVATAPMQSGTTIFLTSFPKAIHIKKGYSIKFSFPIRDVKTGILFSSEEVVHIF